MTKDSDSAKPDNDEGSLLTSSMRRRYNAIHRSDFAALFLKGNNMSTIDALCKAINDKQNIVYPNRGYFRFADIKGDGRNIRKVYVITNDNGGVTACYNGATYRQTAANLRSILSAL
jgi:hypothetical protein